MNGDRNFLAVVHSVLFLLTSSAFALELPIEEDGCDELIITDEHFMDWYSTEIGEAGGGAQRAGDHGFDIAAEGCGLDGGNEEFRFLSRLYSGDFTFETMIQCMQDPGGNGLAGVMVRNRFDQRSLHIFLGIGPHPQGGYYLRGIYRDREGMNSRPYTIVNDKVVDQLPIRLRVSRTAGVLLLEFSKFPDIDSFIEIQTREDLSERVTLNDVGNIGLVVTGGCAGTTLVSFRDIDEPDDPPCILAPQIETIVPDRNKMSLLWEFPLPDCLPPEGSRYAIYRDGIPVGEVPFDWNGTFVDTGAECGVQYCYRVKLKLLEGEGPVSQERCASTVPCLFKRGDVDANGALEVTDVVKFLNYQFIGSYSIECLDAADVDDNGELNVADAIRLLNYQFTGTAAIPEPPGPFECGIDEKPDDLDCQNFRGCP